VVEKEPDPREELRKAGRASAVGWEFAMLIVGPTIGGWWLDRELSWTPTLTLVGLGVGSVAGFWLLFKTARQLSKDAEALEERERRSRRDE
jgi:hypothetical protein